MDYTTGTGSDAKIGDTVTISYKGQFQSSEETSEFLCEDAFKFVIGSNATIKGLDIGVKGMRIGGTREIICPPSTAYGENGIPTLVPPNETIVFVVKLCEIHSK